MERSRLVGWLVGRSVDGKFVWAVRPRSLMVSCQTPQTVDAGRPAFKILQANHQSFGSLQIQYVNILNKDEI